MTNTKLIRTQRILASTLAAATLVGLLLNAEVEAAAVTGTATITINNSALKASNPSQWFIQTHWGASDNALQIDGNTAGGAVVSSTSSTAMIFPVNTNATTTVTSTALYGRTLQATTMDAINISAADKQIGLSGAWRLRDANGTTYLSPYDLSVIKTGGEWIIRTYDNAFSYAPMFKLTNVSESLNGLGQLLLSGNLTWAAADFSWATLLSANTSTIVGTFNLTPPGTADSVAVPAIPVGGLWLFGIGLVAISRVKCRGFVQQPALRG